MQQLVSQNNPWHKLCCTRWLFPHREQTLWTLRSYWRRSRLPSVNHRFYRLPGRILSIFHPGKSSARDLPASRLKTKLLHINNPNPAIAVKERYWLEIGETVVLACFGRPQQENLLYFWIPKIHFLSIHPAFDCDTISHLFRVDALQFPIHGASHVIRLDPATHLSSGGQERPRVFRGVLFGDQHFSISILQLRINSLEPHPVNMICSFTNVKYWYFPLKLKLPCNV